MLNKINREELKVQLKESFRNTLICYNTDMTYINDNGWKLDDMVKLMDKTTDKFISTFIKAESYYSLHITPTTPEANVNNSINVIIGEIKELQSHKGVMAKFNYNGVIGVLESLRPSPPKTTGEKS